VGYEMKEGLLLPERYYLVNYMPEGICSSEIRDIIYDKSLSKEDKIIKIKGIVDEIIV
jgi:hypothetical protein